MTAEPVAVELRLEAPLCSLTLAGEEIHFRAYSAPAGRVALELRLADGRMLALGRLDVAAEGSDLSIPEGLLLAGKNTVSIYAVTGGRTSVPVSFTLDALAPVSAASRSDEDGDCYSPAAGDCDDTNAAIHPGASEVCDDSDNDCDGQFNEGFDADGDGYARCASGASLTHTVAGAACPAGYASCADCNDADKEFHPGASDGFCANAGRGCLATAPTTLDPMGVYVNIANPALGDGSAACPFRRITDGIAAAASGGSVYIGAGTYTAANGEQFPFRLDRSITLEGTSASTTVIEGASAVDLNEHNGFFTAYPYGTSDPTNVTIWAHNPSGVVALKHLSLRPSPSTPSAGVLCDRGTASASPRPTTMPAPNLVFDDVSIGPSYVWAGYIVHGGPGTNAQGCNARFVRSTIQGNQCGFWAAGGGAGENNQHVVHLELGQDAGSGNTLSNTGGTTASLMCNGSSLRAWDGASPLFLRGNTFSSSTRGVEISSFGGLQNLVELSDNSFLSHSSHGVYLENAATIDKLVRNRFESNSNASGTSYGLAMMATSTTIKPLIRAARANVFFSNDTGLYFNSTAATDSPYASLLNNFSSSALSPDPGPNVFACNDAIGTTRGADIRVADAAGDQTKSLRLADNQWDHVPPTRTTTLSTSGTDFVIAVDDALYASSTGAALHTLTCPANRTR